MDENARLIELVRKNYQKVALGDPAETAFLAEESPEALSQSLGYTKEELASVPQEANMGLGCGTPLMLAGLKPGETVVDLGSGAGFDCFLAARQVGEKGLVIGVDMTAEMIAKARHIAEQYHYHHVEFRLGEIENLPLADFSVDVIISNCVINLSSQKERVYREIYRVLKKGGRISISDIVLVRELPSPMKQDEKLYCG